MSAREFDINNLSEQQQLALESYTSVTDQDIEAAIPLLRRSQWNVEIAIAKFFDGEGPDPVIETLEPQSQLLPRSSRQENLQESLIYGNSRPSIPQSQPNPAPRIVPQPDFEVIRRPPYIIGILFTPFNLLCRAIISSYGILTFLFSLSRLRSNNLANRRQSMGRRSLKPRDSAARLKREFEEEYGVNNLPFFEGGYAQALDLAKSKLKFLIILLLSPEHDDTASFAKDTLLDLTVQEYLQDSLNNIILWAGDIRDSEAYQVSTAVKCSKFPFTAVVAHTPNVSPTSMSVIASITGPCDAGSYLTKLKATITKHEEQLAAARSNRSAQDFERSLRQEQDSAYERSLARDRERARLKKEAENAANDEEKRKRAQMEESAKLAEKTLQWRKWRANLIKSEPGLNEHGIVKIALKMPEELGAGRIIRRFRADDAIEELYAFVECYEILRSEKTEDSFKPKGYDHHYKFLLVQSLPRTVYNFDEGGSIGEKIGKTGNLIVELIHPEDQGPEE